VPSNTKTKNHGFVGGIGIAAELGRTHTSIGTSLSCAVSTAYTNPVDTSESSAAALCIKATMSSATYVDISIEFSSTISGTYYKQSLLDTYSSSSYPLENMDARISADGSYLWTVPIADNYMKIGYITDSATAVIDSLEIILSAQPTAWQDKPC